MPAQMRDSLASLASAVSAAASRRNKRPRVVAAEKDKHPCAAGIARVIWCWEQRFYLRVELNWTDQPIRVFGIPAAYCGVIERHALEGVSKMRLHWSWAYVGRP